MKFCGTLKEQRESKDLLLRQLAVYFKVGTVLVSQLEYNKRNASKENRGEIALKPALKNRKKK